MSCTVVHGRVLSEMTIAGGGWCGCEDDAEQVSVQVQEAEVPGQVTSLGAEM